MSTPALHPHEAWLDEVLPKHERLTQTVVSITQSLLKERKVDFLSVSGRTKDRKSTLEKIQRKGYTDPSTKLTDLTGVRVILYIESDVMRATDLIREAFNVDEGNSTNKDRELSTNQIGYRSNHIVCDLGDTRSGLVEHQGLSGLKFEFQIRTVLQHAWAELSHDRSYKFSGKLPATLERQLNLYAGLLEIADRGLNDLASEMVLYSANLKAQGNLEDSSIGINSISLDLFVRRWCEKHKMPYRNSLQNMEFADELITELQQFNVLTLADIAGIVPKDYVEKLEVRDLGNNTHGYVRDWMIIYDWRRFLRDVHFSWILSRESLDFFQQFIPSAEHKKFRRDFIKKDSQMFNYSDNDSSDE